MSSRLHQATPTSVWRTVQQNWRNPVAIAAIASLGIHGLLFWGLPKLPLSALDTKEPESVKSVDLVQLTPEEQRRLPDFSDSQVQLPSIARSATPLPKTSLPNSTATNPDSIFSNPLPPPSSSSSNPVPTWVPPTTLWIPPAADWQPPAPTTKPTTPQQRPSVQQRTQQTQLPPTQQTQPPPTQQTDRTSRTLTADELKSIEKDLNSTASPNQIASSSAPPRTLDNIRQDLRDRILARRQQIAEQQAQDALLVPDATGTAEGEPRNRYAAWFEQATNWLGKDYAGKNAERVKLDVPYPATACQKQLSGTAIVGVVVDPQGKVVTDPIPPAILQGAGYRLFNQQAAAAATAHQFAVTGKRSAYQVEVQFQYNPTACAAHSSPAQSGG